MKAITVQLPWADAIARGAKLVENRSRPTGYRGLLAIHAGAEWSVRGASDPACRAMWWGPAWHTRPALEATDFSNAFRRILAVVEVVGCHEAQPISRLDGSDGVCCEPWGQLHYGSAGARVFHWELASVRRLPEPVECRGRLGLWNVPDDIAEALR